MRIYTYYEPLQSNFSYQEALISLWSKTWAKNNWEVFVLNQKHAECHPFYSEYTESMTKLCYEITGKPILAYGMSCWNRWLAYATQVQNNIDKDGNERPFFVCDYDLINNGFTPEAPLKDKIHFMDDLCPCLVSGKPSDFYKLAKFFVNITKLRIDQLKNNIFLAQEGVKSQCYHDQDLLINNLLPRHCSYAAAVKKDHGIVTSVNKKRIGAPFVYGSKEQCKAIHFSKNNALQIKNSVKEFANQDPNYIRLQLIQDFFKEIL